MEASKDVAVWFEIPVTDMARAAKFYETVLGTKLEMSEMGPIKMAVFPVEKQAVHGALVQGPEYQPGETGTLLYLNAGQDLTPAQARVQGAGGQVLKPKLGIGPHGFIAIFKDTEGNRLALHSPN